MLVFGNQLTTAIAPLREKLEKPKGLIQARISEKQAQLNRFNMR